MGKSNPSPAGRKATQKPAKPHPDFPLYSHASGRWAKRVRGKIWYFGPWDDPQGALERWLDQKDDLLAGRKPRLKDEGLRLVDLCNHFLTFKQGLVDSGELAPRTFARYHATCALLVAVFGKNTLVASLRPRDFESLRGQLANRYSPVALANEIQIVRTLFRYAIDAELLDRPVRFGPGFREPSARTLRQARVANGPRLFTPEQIRLLLNHAGVNMKAMILLAANGGLGNTDLGMLPITAIDVDTGWLDYPRAKTAMPRRFPLWPETHDAIRFVIEHRRPPKDDTDALLLFIGSRGKSYVGKHKGYRVTQEFARVCKTAAIEGRCFYDLRRTFQTIAERCRDLVAVRAIMGHAPASGDMSAIYRQQVEDDRLQLVVDTVRDWLFPATKATPHAKKSHR